MALTPRQIAVRAQEAAWQMLAALERGRLVANFLDSYAREFNRPTTSVHPAHYTEMLETIRRESLLEMVIYVEAEFPRRLGILVRQRKKTTPKKRAHKQAKLEKSARRLVAERQMTDLFRQEFYVSLGKALGWRKEEFGEFWRDHEIYQQLSAGQAREQKKRATIIEGPFVDRCALLLDPSFLDMARRAAAKFRAQLHGVASSVLRRAFVQRRQN